MLAKVTGSQAVYIPEQSHMQMYIAWMVTPSLGTRPLEIGTSVWEIGWDGSLLSGTYGICNY